MQRRRAAHTLAALRRTWWASHPAALASLTVCAPLWCCGHHRSDCCTQIQPTWVSLLGPYYFFSYRQPIGRDTVLEPKYLGK